MDYTIDKDPSYSIVRVVLEAGERVGARPGAMVSRSDSVDPQTSVGGGSLTGLLTRAISDEQDVVENYFEATRDGGQVVLAPVMPGDVVAVDVGETGSLRVQSGGALAWADSVEHSTALNEATNFFSSGELTVLGLAGEGTAFLSAFGAIYADDVTPDDPVVVDEDHLLAWTDGLSVSRTTDGGLKSTLLGGEGRVSRLSGEGRVWLQTRDPVAFRSLVAPPRNDG